MAICYWILKLNKQKFCCIVNIAISYYKTGGEGFHGWLGNQESDRKVTHLQVQNANESQMSCNTVLLVSLLIK